MRCRPHNPRLKDRELRYIPPGGSPRSRFRLKRVGVAGALGASGGAVAARPSMLAERVAARLAIASAADNRPQCLV